VGVVRFNGVYLIDKQALRAKAPDSVKNWPTLDKGKLRVITRD